MNETELKQEEAQPELVVPKKPSISFGSIVSSLKAAVKNGKLSLQEARNIRLQFGINQSFFTRKKTSAAVRKKARKQQKLSRKQNRHK